MASSIPLRRRVEYARGFLELGLLEDARAEIEALDPKDRRSMDALSAMVDIEMEAKRWSEVIATASHAVQEHPACERGWIGWAYALRELKRVEEARDILLQAEQELGDACGLLHYNLSCYFCLLGDLEEAQRRLERACQLDSDWRGTALEDPDLEALKPQLLGSS
ncbi:hypothetical protein DB347_10815 [Opitutaceae bacterium EW11]|nr:hypothetical protein DB347_10815 [Opitutaceae bacterium EW11]